MVRVWSADMAGDGGRDEYVRSLTEWTALAGEVSWKRERVKQMPNMYCRFIGKSNKARKGVG
jgi:hypothetical protein